MTSVRELEVPQDHSIQMIVCNDRRIVIWLRKFMVEIEQFGRNVTIVKTPYRDDSGYVRDVAEDDFNQVNEAYAVELEAEQKV